MPGLGDPTGTRLVPKGRFIFVTEQEFQDWSYAVDVANLDIIEKHCDPLLQRYRDAPADPAEALLQALAGWISGDPKVDLADFSNDLYEVVTAVLAALGCVVERPANTGDHQ